MKKVFLAAVFVAGLSVTFMACNNGDYNANPDKNQDYFNPLNPETGVTIPFGRIQAEIDGSLRTFDSVAGWTDSVPSVAMFQGIKYDNAHTAEFIGATLTPYAGVTGNYFIFDSLTNDIYYGVMDTNNHSVYTLYNGKITTGGSGQGYVNLKGTESGRFRGTFSATLYKTIPVLDFTDVRQITNGEFYVPKY
ncbi:MAG: hypothetical protein BGO69_17805 [Bacteroidetes bacterium 46-16]|nr:MAG: hypothetical protein BGO69_17805 [Bacteroidetes bacterium 46-16]